MSAVSSRNLLRRALGHAWLIVLCAFVVGPSILCAQTPLSGTSVADPAGPTIISPSAYSGPSYFVLNKDLSVSGRPISQSAQSVVCSPPSGFDASSTTPRTLLNDSTTAYFTAQSSSANLAASTASNSYPCSSAAPLSFAGGVPTQTFSTNDPRHGRYYVLESFNGNGPDTLTLVSNLNTNTSSTPTLTKESSVTVDTGATYTAMLTDVTSDYGNTVITEMRTDTSPGGLLVYSPTIQTVFRILGPGGVPLPAIGAFFMPSPANDNGQLLVLINQDNLTAANSSNPPAITNPFTIIDLGQLQRAFSAVVSQGTTITLPSVTQIPAASSYYAMLGAVYSPVFHLAYALVAGGTSSSAVTQSIIRYDPTNPSAPAETVVADVSNIPFTLGTYPQLALNAAGGTLEILSNGSLYHVSVAGKGNTAVAVSGSTFGDSNFKPTFIASNPLLGETYIASAASVDILGLSGSSTKRATFELYGRDNAIANQSYTLNAYAVNPDYDSDLTFATVTFTGTPDGGSPITLGTGQFYQFTGAGTSSTSFKFPTAGIYTVVATIPATTHYPAITSLPIRVGVGATAVAPVYPTNTRLIVPSTSNSTTVTGQLTLFGSTYAPSGRIIVSDADGNQVGRYNFTGGATTYPVNVTLTLPTGSSTLTAVYNGDTQNQGSTSPDVTVVVGNQTKSTLGLSVPSKAVAGATVSGTVFYSAAAGSTGTPTGNILIQATAGTTTTTVATVPVATAFNNPTTGASFTFTAPAAGTYSLTSTYAGDSNFSSAVSAASSLVTTSPLIATTVSVSAVATATAGTAFPVTVTLKTASSGSAAPSGSIVVQATNAGGSVTALGTITAAQASVSGGYALQATLATSGTYTITATYNGDASYGPSSGTIGVAVKGTFVRFEVTVPPSEPIGNLITGTLYITLSGSTASPTGNYIVTATNVATGAVTPLATVAASQSAPQGTSSTLLNFTYTAPGPSGLFRVDATYGGDTNYPAANSYVNFNAVTPTTAPTTISLSLPTTGVPYDFVPVTAYLNVKSPPATPPTGKIIFTIADSTGVFADFGDATAANATAPSGVTIMNRINTPGTYTIKATYGGDSLYAGSVQTNTIVIARSAVKLAITGPASTTTGTGASFNIALTGYVIAPTNSTTLTSVSSTGASGPQSSVTGSGGAAVLTFNTPGSYTLTANFGGDGSNLPASATFAITVTGNNLQDFNMTFDDPNTAIVPVELQSHDTMTDVPFTLTAINGFSGTATLTATFSETDNKNLGANEGYYILIDEKGKQLSTNPGIHDVITIPTAAGLHLRVRLRGTGVFSSNHNPFSKATGISFAGLLAGIGFLGWRKRRLFSPRLLHLLLVVVVVAGAGSVLAGCGADNSSFRVTLTATPNGAGTVKTISFPVHYTN